MLTEIVLPIGTKAITVKEIARRFAVAINPDSDNKRQECEALWLERIALDIYDEALTARSPDTLLPVIPERISPEKLMLPNSNPILRDGLHLYAGGCTWVDFEYDPYFQKIDINDALLNALVTVEHLKEYAAQHEINVGVDADTLVTVEDLALEIAQEIALRSQEWQRHKDKDAMSCTIVTTLHKIGHPDEALPGVRPHIMKMLADGEIPVRSTRNGLPPVSVSEVKEHQLDKWNISQEEADKVKALLLPEFIAPQPPTLLATHRQRDIKTERGCRRLIREKWETIRTLHGPNADARQVLNVLTRHANEFDEMPKLKTVQNKLRELRKANLIP